MRIWVGAALLAGSWVFGYPYFQPPNGLVWLALVAVGAACFYGVGRAAPNGLVGLGAILLAAPALWIAPWPLRAAPLALALGLLLQILPFPRTWPGRAGQGLFACGGILTVQALGLFFYRCVTGRSHELPDLLAWIPLAVARLLGMPAAASGDAVALHTMRKVHLLGTTWELFFDPVSLAFGCGGVAILAARAIASPGPWRAHAKAVAGFAFCLALWLPVRLGLLLGLFMHRALFTDYDAPLALMGLFYHPWILLALLAPLTLLAWRFVRWPDPAFAEDARVAIPVWRAALPLSAFALAVFALTLATYWDPLGVRKGGRVLVDEYHSTWEPTERPFDTEWYGTDAGYNYACIYDYCSRFYAMGRLKKPMDDAALADCDVLILKVPTSAYAPSEVEAVQAFVERGGGLMLVGEHTNVFRTGTHLNQIAERFGFRFRYDCIFDFENTYGQRQRDELAPHPIMRGVHDLGLAVSCSIAPARASGRAVMVPAGLWSLPADYHASNFYPQVVDRADARYGAFVQLWAMRHGAGRVVAFADSTIFSNFSAFEPGKSELMLSMIEWLNCGNAIGDPRPWLLCPGLLLLGVATVLAVRRSRRALWLLGGAAGLFAWSLAVSFARGDESGIIPPQQRPCTRVMTDRTVCDGPLSDAGFIKASERGFGIFEQWMLRLGYFTARRSGAGVFEGDVAVFLQPRGHAPRDFRDALVAYVRNGGKVLLLDSALNRASTANSLLYPFEMSFEQATLEGGNLTLAGDWPAVPVESVREVKGGEPLARLGDATVGAWRRFGKGLVVAIGFGSRFNDDHMGIMADIVPKPDQRAVFEVEFALMRAIVEDRLPTLATSGSTSAPKTPDEQVSP